MNHSHELAESLLASGAQALEHAAGLVEGKPELAVITFAVGVELTLKARLAFEHWHLVLVDDKQQGKLTDCWNQLREGKVRTVGADRVRVILLRVLPLIEARALERSMGALSSLAELRNQAAHFGIPLSGSGGAALLAAVQLRAWHALHEFSRTWPESLRERAERDWSRAESALRKLGAFLQTRSDELLPHLKDLQQEGGAVGLCMECNYIGLAREKEEGFNFRPTYCRICKVTSLAAVGSCPSCSKHILASLVQGKFELSCVTCNYEGDAPEFGSVRVSAPTDHGEAPFCGCCDSAERTLQLHTDGQDWIVCSTCQSIWSSVSSAVSFCENCDEQWVGLDLELSGLSGCPHCKYSIRERAERI